VTGPAIDLHASANPAEVAAVRAALGHAGIPFEVSGDLTLGHRGCVIPARVRVAAADADRARDVLRSLLGR
jgi:hypothetical protein